MIEAGSEDPISLGPSMFRIRERGAVGGLCSRVACIPSRSPLAPKMRKRTAVAHPARLTGGANRTLLLVFLAGTCSRRTYSSRQVAGEDSHHVACGVHVLDVAVWPLQNISRWIRVNQRRKCVLLSLDQ